MTKESNTTSALLPQPWDTNPLHSINVGANPTYPAAPSAYKFDLAVFITRAQGLHLGHEENIKRALQVAQRVLVIVGSAGKARDTRNPFTFEERKATIEDAFNHDPRISIVGQRDHPYNDTMWQSYIQKVVKAEVKGIEDPRIALVGHRKEDTGYYIDMFTKWEFVEVGQTIDVCASDIRNVMYNPDISVANKLDKLRPYMSEQGLAHLMLFAYNIDMNGTRTNTPEMERLMREAAFLKRHAASWASAPYAPTFVTVDAVVIQSGHVLLIKRRSAPGEGLWAIPGGYLDKGERIRDAYIRELVEETKIKVSANTIRGSVVDQDVFDYPGRSLRGRIITHAFCVKLRDGKLPAVKAASDAKRAVWVPLDEFYQMQDQMFEDHWYIIDHFLSRLKDNK